MELFDAILPDQTDAWLRIRQRILFPVRYCLASDCRNRLECRVARIQQLLTGGNEFAFRTKCVGGLILLAGIQCFVCT